MDKTFILLQENNNKMITKQIFKNRQTLLYITICLMILTLGIYFRLSEISSRNLEYDEIWTITHYSNASNIKIFTKLTTPNNHPLNSFLIKYSLLTFGENYFAVRFPALIAGIFLMLLMPLLSYIIFKNCFIAIFTLLLTAFNGILVHYSQTARGYEIQTTLLILFIYCIIYIEQKNRYNFYLYLMIFVFLPILCVLTIPTSILFLIPLIIIHAIYIFYRNIGPDNKKIAAFLNVINNKKSFFYYLLLICLVGWFWYNFWQFIQGQNFGKSIASIKQFYSFVYSLLTSLNVLPLLIVIIIGLFLKNLKIFYLSFSALCTCAFIIFSTFFIKAGPARVYIPIIPMLIFVGSGSLFYLLKNIFPKKRIAISLFFIIGMSWIVSSFWGNLQAWTPPQYRKTYNLLCKNLPINTFIVFPAGHGYPASFNNKFGLVQNHLRIPHSNNSAIAIYPASNFIDGINKKSQVSKIKIPESIKHKNYSVKNSKLYIYKLAKLQRNTTLKNKVIIAVLNEGRSKDINHFVYALMNELNENWIMLNSWFKVQFSFKSNLSSAVLACFSPKTKIEKLISI